jgi:hypothetical protein
LFVSEGRLRFLQMRRRCRWRNMREAHQRHAPLTHAEGAGRVSSDESVRPQIASVMGGGSKACHKG